MDDDERLFLEFKDEIMGRKRAMNQAFRWAETHDVGTLDGFMLVVGRFQHFYLTGEIMTP